MKRKTVGMIMFGLALLALTWLTGSGCRHTACCSADLKDAAQQLTGTVEDGVRVVKISAKQYTFTPNHIVVNQGEKVRLVLNSEDVKHGFALKEYKIDQAISPGAATTVEFVADKPGKFTFHCSVFCGMGHMKMHGELVVLPASPATPAK